jgi:hypothetical protein
VTLVFTGLLFWRGALQRAGDLYLSLHYKRLKEMVSVISKNFSEKNFQREGLLWVG